MTKSLPKVECIARARIPTTQGPDIFLHLYTNDQDNKEHLAIVFGEDIRSRSLFRQRPNETQQDRMIRGAYVGKLHPGRTIADKDDRLGLQLHFDTNGELLPDYNFTTWDSAKNSTLVRIHSECYTGENAWSARCDCGEQFDRAGKLISLDVEPETGIKGGNGHGVIVYLRQEGRGIGLGEKLKAYNLQDLGADTVQANLLLKHPVDSRDFSLGKSILIDLGIENVRLLTNNPDKINQIDYPPILKCVERVPMVPIHWTDANKGIDSKEIEGYLRTKIERMGHLLTEPLTLHSSEQQQHITKQEQHSCSTHNTANTETDSTIVTSTTKRDNAKIINA
ncbi:GTP cyclohydrolase II NDAI_0A05390 [Naumovozyma dairenensis CBS 421]|uniref:GTP cyclohydrolase II n=1 Tax=Naumovozyma dairenensis (strain ATCC 10597 / BCRC 20456 / CBS 421 / NBRC 0211 / NRRL Y-12639) TaxID=1071378 RepID=G0W4F6_NAUDC|nr:hypothetical protein NDAI_0A05390 [Naumovozyma dairenensis CBS 421]CCD22694.1 hypothetical protein NDAI_0A05390 [Naumovozyma dairenensis CBS 421]